MKVRMHVERLVFDGLELSPAEAEQVEEAFVKELTRLLSEVGPDLGQPTGHRGSVLRSVSRVALGTNPRGIGEQIGRIVHDMTVGRSGKDGAPAAPQIVPTARPDRN